MPATTTEATKAAKPLAKPRSAAQKRAAKAAARSTDWAPGCPPPPAQMDVAAFNGWRESMTAEARKRCRGIYLYRTWPLIDMRVVQEFTHIEVLEDHPFDLAGIARRHGGGKYNLVMGYVGTHGDKQAKVAFEVDTAEHAPILDVRTLLVDEPANRAYVGALKRKGVLDKDGNPVPSEREEMSGLLQTLVEKATSDKGLTAADLRAAIAEQQGGAQKEMLAVFGPILAKVAEAGLGPREAPPGLTLEGLASLVAAMRPEPAPPRDDALLLELVRQRTASENGGGMAGALGLFKEMLGLAKGLAGGEGEKHWAAHFAEPLAHGIQAATAYFQWQAAKAGGAEPDGGPMYETTGPQALEAVNPMAEPVIGFLETSAPVLLPMIQDPKKSGRDAAQIALPFLATNPAVAEALLALGVDAIVDLFDQAPAYQAATLSESRLKRFVGEFIGRLEELKQQATAQAQGGAAA